MQGGIGKFIFPRRFSLYDDEATIKTTMQASIARVNRMKQEALKERQAIQLLVKQKIEAFVKEQVYLVDANLEDVSQVRESKLNLYEPVFSIAIPDFIEDYQCLPNFQMYWDPPWGGMVTIKIISTLKQYNFFTLMLQDLTDLLVKSHQMMSS